MNQQKIVEELLSILEANNVLIRREQLGGGGGGLCTVKGQLIFFVDTQASLTEVATLCAQAVLKVVDIDKVYIRPAARQFIENYINSE